MGQTPKKVIVVTVGIGSSLCISAEILEIPCYSLTGLVLTASIQYIDLDHKTPLEQVLPKAGT